MFRRYIYRLVAREAELERSENETKKKRKGATPQNTQKPTKFLTSAKKGKLFNMGKKIEQGVFTRFPGSYLPKQRLEIRGDSYPNHKPREGTRTSEKK